MAYPFMAAGASIQKTPKQDYTELFQENLYDQFYNASDVYTITEETSLFSGVYQNVDVRINSLVSPTTGDNVEDDFKKLLFQDITHSVNLGRYYQFDSNYWITINVDKIKSLAQTAVVRRCNNVLRWIDEETGALYQVPCALGYLIKENRDYSTAGSAIVVPSGMIDCFVQNNTMVRKIKPNQRFLFGNSNNWTAYRVEGGGINNFNNQQTLDNTSAGLTRYSLAVDYVNPSTDDIVNGIANVTDNTYVLTLNQSSISGSATQTVQLVATVALNGETVTRSLVWTTSNTAVATVSSGGLVTFIATGSATITCQMADNTTVMDTCPVTVGASPVDNYQVIALPDINYILEGVEKTWTVYLYKNGVQQADTFVFTLDPNTVTTANYTYTVLGNNSFKIKNIKKFLTDVLEVTCTSGIYSRVISVSLRGAW